MELSVIFQTLQKLGISHMFVYRTCVPNTHFQLNGRVCFCDYTGRWTEANCNTIIRRDSCLPGQIIWEDCSQCICQENGRLLCTNTTCVDEFSSSPHQTTQLRKGGHECTPFRSYYIDCHLCSCPASGLTKEARCVPDSSCLTQGPMSSDFRVSLRSACIPNVMYLFHCMSCMCSENGYFIISTCVDTCNRNKQNNLSCIPGTLYKSGCNICKCPNNSVPDGKLCTNIECKYESKKSLEILKNETRLCIAHKFTEPKCFYCECGEKGKIKEQACYELKCLNDSDIRYDLQHHSCSSGEYVPFCMECFCPYNGLTDERLCSKSCSFKNKLYILEKLLKENLKYPGAFIRKDNEENSCEPHSVFIDNGKYCICPDNGDAKSKLCTLAQDHKFPNPQMEQRKKDSVNHDIPCTPNTFVDFECNTCYCNRSGKIDIRWCTYDDCEAKRHMQRKIRAEKFISDPNKCTPGSISKRDCNFCICPDSRLIRERVCTKNKCRPDEQSKEFDEKLFCDAMEYYTVDCNVCYCPQDGLKNIEKCTKNVCEKNFLRSNLCESGELFANDCNICVCPPNGDKKGSMCTNHTCSDADTPWKKIFKLTQDLLDTNNLEQTTRNIYLCFPGEEFIVGCKVCVCPDMGLRAFAACTPLSCNSTQEAPTSDIEFDELNTDDYRRRSKVGEHCMKINLTDSTKKECTPGSTYIIRCRECICPFMGDINLFCRPLPKGVYCEQAFPYFNYLPQGRRVDKDNSTTITNSPKVEDYHKHTSHNCNKSGYVMDECFICECKARTVIEEHCFKNDDAKCAYAKPTFLDTAFVSDS
ncbi:hypothetical protein K1T71_012935 [Dendrolimus kikuchii]|uniref:Uncharacterized protein n=1 Tax=Dendrolimus kikuchii TaxID=765133 RepID=A0ACC1CIM3_9NEOP|nr:hypothetical protein K1T71_012935 [Dendrolimus kikuchii]